MLTVKLSSSAYHQGLRGVLWVVKRPLSHPVWDSTTPAHPEVDRRRRGSSVPGEQPRSSPSLGTVVVTPCRHSGARRVYDKTHYCLCCSRPYAKIVRHLEGAHGDKSDVAQALSLPKGSKERKRRLDHIRNRGNYAHNTSVMQSGDGALQTSSSGGPGTRLHALCLLSGTLPPQTPVETHARLSFQAWIGCPRARTEPCSIHVCVHGTRPGNPE